MKDKILNSLKENKVIVEMVLLMVIVAFAPLPALWVEILIVLITYLAFAFLVVIICTKKDFSFYPTFVHLSTILGMGFNASIARHILTKGAGYDGFLIKAFSLLFFGSKKENLTIGLIIFILVISYIELVIVRSCTRVSEVAARFTLDSSQIKLMKIDTEYNSGAITEDEAQAMKQEVQKKADFLGKLDGASKFVSGNIKCSIIILWISFFGAILISILFNNETINEAAKTYFPLIICGGILCNLPISLVSFGFWIIVTRNGGRISFKKRE